MQQPRPAQRRHVPDVALVPLDAPRVVARLVLLLLLLALAARAAQLALGRARAERDQARPLAVRLPERRRVVVVVGGGPRGRAKRARARARLLGLGRARGEGRGEGLGARDEHRARERGGEGWWEAVRGERGGEDERERGACARGGGGGGASVPVRAVLLNETRREGRTGQHTLGVGEGHDQVERLALAPRRAMPAQLVEQGGARRPAAQRAPDALKAGLARAEGRVDERDLDDCVRVRLRGGASQRVRGARRGRGGRGTH